MKSDDPEDFMTVMGKEIKYLTIEDVWEIIPKPSLKTSAHIIRLLWSFKSKRNPFGELIKNNAHVFLHSGMIDCHSTFAPVVNWSTVELMMMMTEIAGWESIKIYYVITFSQEPIDSDVYIHLPKNWFDILKNGVEDKGLVFFTRWIKWDKILCRCRFFWNMVYRGCRSSWISFAKNRIHYQVCKFSNRLGK